MFENHMQRNDNAKLTLSMVLLPSPRAVTLS